MVELADGTEAVLGVQRPYAREQIKANIARPTAFVQKLKERGIETQSAVANSLLASLEDQLMEETRMAIEAKKVLASVETVEKVNKALKPISDGWTIKAPSLIGELIVQASLRGFFGEGFFDPDRHKGNILIDVENKQISMIDFGQAERYSSKSRFVSDERFELAQFARYMFEGDAAGVVKYGLALTDKKKLSPQNQKHLSEAVGKTLSAKTLSSNDRLIALVDHFTSVQYSEMKYRKKKRWNVRHQVLVQAAVAPRIADLRVTCVAP